MQHVKKHDLLFASELAARNAIRELEKDKKVFIDSIRLKEAPEGYRVEWEQKPK